MTANHSRVEPAQIVDAVDDYVSQQLSDTAKYMNRHPFDESGVWDLHRLAADIYAAGWADGEQAQLRRATGQRLRDREIARAATPTDTEGGNE